jgi:hypothetical protein
MQPDSPDLRRLHPRRTDAAHLGRATAPVPWLQGTRSGVILGALRLLHEQRRAEARVLLGVLAPGARSVGIEMLMAEFLATYVAGAERTVALLPFRPLRPLTPETIDEKRLVMVLAAVAAGAPGAAAEALAFSHAPAGRGEILRLAGLVAQHFAAGLPISPERRTA